MLIIYFNISGQSWPANNAALRVQPARRDAGRQVAADAAEAINEMRGRDAPQGEIAAARAEDIPENINHGAGNRQNHGQQNLQAAEIRVANIANPNPIMVPHEQIPAAVQQQQLPPAQAGIAYPAVMTPPVRAGNHFLENAPVVHLGQYQPINAQIPLLPTENQAQVMHYPYPPAQAGMFYYAPHPIRQQENYQFDEAEFDNQDFQYNRLPNNLVEANREIVRLRSIRKNLYFKIEVYKEQLSMNSNYRYNAYYRR